MDSKPQQILNALAAHDDREALRLAASFPHLGKEKEAITRGWAALTRPDFYRQLGKDPEALVAVGVVAVKNRYVKTTDEDWKSIEQKQQRKTRRCSYCGSELHTLKDCPELLKRQDRGV